MYHARSAVTQIGRVRRASAREPTSLLWSVHRANRGPPWLTFEVIGAPSSLPLVRCRLWRGRRHVQASRPRPRTHQTQQRDCVSSTTFSGNRLQFQLFTLEPAAFAPEQRGAQARSDKPHLGISILPMSSLPAPRAAITHSRRMPHEANSGGLGSTARLRLALRSCTRSWL